MSVEGQADTRRHLLVIQGETSSRLDLPWTGVLRIGRDPDADITVNDGMVSRDHARLLLSDGDVSITDLGSRNGTQVNGERIDTPDGARPLVVGDVISIGSAHLVLAGKPRPPSPTVRDSAEVRRRLVEEIDRALGSGRTVAVIALRCARRPTPPKIAAAVEAVGRLGVIGREGERRMYVLLPETDADRGAEIAGALARTLNAHAGIALCPHDACDADAALAAARTAADAATEGAVGTIADTEVERAGRTHRDPGGSGDGPALRPDRATGRE